MPINRAMKLVIQFPQVGLLGTSHAKRVGVVMKMWLSTRITPNTEHA